MTTAPLWHRLVATALGVIAGTVATLGIIAVATAGFALSFDAIRYVATAAHIREAIAWMLPVTVDGAMAVATVTAVVLHRMARPTWYPWLVVATGVAISVACNALHAWQAGRSEPLPAEVAMAVSAIPAVLLALSVHLLVTLVDAVSRRATVAGVVTDPQVAKARADADAATRELTTLVRQQARTARLQLGAMVPALRLPDAPMATMATPVADRPANGHQRPTPPATPAPEPVRREVATESVAPEPPATPEDRRRVVASLLQADPDIGAKRVHARTGIPERTAGRILAELRGQSE